MKNIFSLIVNVPFSESFFQNFLLFIKWLNHRKLSNNFYITERIRPKKLSQVKNLVEDNSEDVAILIRGSILFSDQFTFNTIDFYRQYYPDAIIYLSTWDNYESDLIRYQRDKNIKIVTSKFIKPKKGQNSTNLQIKGNLQALKKIKEDRIKFTLTTRSDQRFYQTGILKFLKILHKQYKYKKYNNEDKQLSRLIGLSFNTFLYRVYGLNDMFLFGLTDDVYNYWDSSFESRIFSDEKKYKKYSMLSYSKERVNEVYFMSEFLKRNGHNLKWNLEDYWDVLSKRFIITDSSSLDFFWPKYTFLEERWKKYNKGIQFKEISFSDWLLLTEGKLAIDEKIINLDIN